MIRDLFHEQIVERKKDAKDILMMVGIIIAGLILMFMVRFIPLINQLPIVAVAGIIYGIIYFIRQRNLEYEYIFTNGELDIDRIVSRSKRKRILSVNVKDFEIFAPEYDEAYNRYSNDPNIDKVIRADRNVKSKNTYFAIFRKQGEKVKLVFDPNKDIFESIQKYIPRVTKGEVSE